MTYIQIKKKKRLQVLEINKKRANLQTNVAKSFLGIRHSERTVTFGTDFASLKFLNAVNEAVKAGPITTPFLRQNPSSTTWPWARRYPSPSSSAALHFPFLPLSLSLYNNSSKLSLLLNTHSISYSIWILSPSIHCELVCSGGDFLFFPFFFGFSFQFLRCRLQISFQIVPEIKLLAG